jgi:acid phosphatase family membrane protein YuiD
MNIGYVITPFIAWLLAGSIKFIINSVNAGKLAFWQIGYGGLPSNHSAIVSSMAALIAFREGIANPAFGVALALAFIVMLDANSLRRQVGKQAAAINRLNKTQNIREPLRERMGHSRIEIIAGIILGIATAWLVDTIINYALS